MCRPYSVLHPVGFTVPPLLPATAVRSCRTLSTLPGRRPGGILSVALSLPRRGQPAGRYPAPWFHGARTFLVSACTSRGRPALWQAAI